MKKILKNLYLCIGSIFVMNAQSAQPTSGAYITDPQSEYVQDQISEGSSQADSILCFIANTRPDAMVNKDAYVAFIDESKCDSSSKADPSNSTSEGGGSSTSYTRLRLTSTRADNTSAQVLKGHASMTMGKNNAPAYVYIHASGTKPPSDTVPNGVIEMNFAGKLVSNNQTVMRGRLNATISGLEFSMAQYGGGNYQMFVSGTDASGSGAIRFPSDPATPNTLKTFTFGYNSTTFCRTDGTTEVCFLRSKDQANTSVWQYGIYDDDTGKKYDLDTPGFPIKSSTGEFGFASYWGIWLPTAVSNGDVIKNQDASVIYTVSKTGGRLTKYTLLSKKLDDVKGIPFNFFANSNVTIGSASLEQGNQYEAYWNGTNFTVTDKMKCGQSGCFKENLPSALTATGANLVSATLPAGAPASMSPGVNGWSQALGGNLMIPTDTLSNASPGTQTIKYNTQSVVSPGDTSVPTSLKCARDCPTAITLAGATGSNSAYTSGTANKGGGTTSIEAYTWDSTTYQLRDANDQSVKNSLLPTTLNPQYSFGTRSGALVAGSKFASGGSMECPGNPNPMQYCDFKANAETEYYVWENGKTDFQSATFLKKSDDTFVKFTPPQSASFDVPSDPTKYGNFAGTKLNLQFMGFGNLGGIPGKCFDPANNGEVSCGPNTRYVPAFSIPVNTATSTTGKVTIGNDIKWIKFLNREIRFKKDGVVGTGGYARPAGITMGDVTKLPIALSAAGGDDKDPSVTANSTYAGTVSAGDFEKKPSIIQGVVQ